VGCGTDCTVTAVVDAHSGKVFFAPFIAYSGVAFQLDSRLLIENPPSDDNQAADDPAAEFDRPGYWLWDGSKFTLLARAAIGQRVR